MSHEVDGLVVGGVDYGDADRVVHLLTPNGRMAAFAHGARKSKRRFQGALDPFTSIRATIVPSKRAEGMPTLSGAVVVDPRLSIRSDLKRIALASYVVELGARVAPEGQATDGIYPLVVLVLDHLAEKECEVTLSTRRAFELRLLDVLGYRPDLDRCIVCRDPPPSPHLDLVHGGVLCAEHRGHAKAIGPNTLAWMRALLEDRDVFDPRGGLDPVSADRVARALTSPMSEFFASLINRPLKSAALLEDVMHAPGSGVL
jgi:DNA repair protein RecO (recombination protein O)